MNLWDRKVSIQYHWICARYGIAHQGIASAKVGCSVNWASGLRKPRYRCEVERYWDGLLGLRLCIASGDMDLARKV